MMSTVNIIKRSILAAIVVLTLGAAALQPAAASVTGNNSAPVERPVVGDGQETHGGKG